MSKDNTVTVNQMPIPEAAFRDAQAMEILRVWIAEQSLHCSLKVGMYRDAPIPEEQAWGTILADAAKHISNAMAGFYKRDATDCLQKIQDAFVQELEEPTSVAKGEFSRKN